MKKRSLTKPFKLLALLLSFSLLGACSSGPHAAQPSERQAKAMAMWEERCKTAGEKIYKTVENVEGIYLMKIRTTTNFGEQFKLDDPYGSDMTGDTYILNFLRGFHHQSKVEPYPGSPPRAGYRYVEAQDPLDGTRHRYTAAKTAVRKMDANAENVQISLKLDPNFDLNVYEFVLTKVPAQGKAPRYGVTYDDISTREEREHWIAGSSLKVIDLEVNEVIAERIGYMVDWAQGSQAGGRSPWLLAANQACPNFQRNPLRPPLAPDQGSTAQLSQTLDFAEKVLKPSK